MFARLYSRRSVYFNIALLLLLVVVWCISYAGPVFKTFFKDEHLFYGSVSYAAIPSVFGGSNVPFLDKTFFKINGDDKATFVLYASEEMLESMSDWFNFAAVNVDEVPLEINAVRIAEDRFVVRSIASTYGELDWETVVEYHVFYSLIALGIIGFCAVGFVICFILAIKSKP